jgi:hypothetical protein
MCVKCEGSADIAWVKPGALAFACEADDRAFATGLALISRLSPTVRLGGAPNLTNTVVGAGRRVGWIGCDHPAAR